MITIISIYVNQQNLQKLLCQQFIIIMLNIFIIIIIARI